jgi:hypothetical protein
MSRLPDPYRPVEESLREFENMKNGKYDANKATLRMKMDMLSPNPNMWDQVRPPSCYHFLSFLMIHIPMFPCPRIPILTCCRRCARLMCVS